jgi:hypothetical protein
MKENKEMIIPFMNLWPHFSNLEEYVEERLESKEVLMS